MTRLTDPGFVPPVHGIGVTASALRSTHLERDVAAAELPSLHLGRRTQEILQRIGSAVADTTRARAWSITGPYGSGKSTLALLLDALLGSDPGKYQEACRLVAQADPGLAQLFGPGNANPKRAGFMCAIATARREPVSDTVARAIVNGATRRWAPPHRVPRKLARAIAPLQNGNFTSADILGAVSAACDEGPVILIVDEFGKNLEYVASQSDAPANGGGDLYLLQELAERGAGTRGLPLYILTLQHLSFLDYAAQSHDAERREWAKVQGRFDDITIGPDIGDAVQLIARSIDQSAVEVKLRREILRYGDLLETSWSEHGLDSVLPADRKLFTSLYPLQPLTAVVAPLVAAQIGQNERSLTAFLAADEPHTVRRFLETGARGTIGLSTLYDFFLTSNRSTMLASTNASRWIEIESRVGEAAFLDSRDLGVLKTVGLLNLVDSAGALRASFDLLDFSHHGPSSENDGEARRDELRARLESLVQRGFLVYREFSDEYRVWRGSDTDVSARIEEARSRCGDLAVIDVVKRHLPPAIAAGQHSQRTGILRHFVTTATAPATIQVEGPSIDSGADGILVYHLGPRHELPKTDSVLPVAIGTVDQPMQILSAGREVVALEEVAADKNLDAVARNEVAERIGQATARLAAIVTTSFRPTNPGTRWRLITEPLDIGGCAFRTIEARSMAGVVSEACHVSYRDAPEIRNEMLGRNQLTSQGAKARRELLTRMTTESSKENLGIDGYGPDRAMYSGVLGHLGLHKRTGLSSEDYHFTAPDKTSSLLPAWSALVAKFDAADQQTGLMELMREMLAPPYGIKLGLAPLVVATALIVHSETVAVFEEGTYQPRLTPDVLERLVKSPQRFTIKSVPTASGQRRQVIDGLSDHFSIDRSPHASNPNRNIGILSVTRVLVDRARALSSHARATKRISTAAAQVRAALTTATDPDELIFTELPHALGLKSIRPRAQSNAVAAAAYVNSLSNAMDELGRIDAALIDTVIGEIAAAFRLPFDLTTLRHDLAARTRGYSDRLIDSRLRGLIAICQNDQLPNDEWLDPFVVRIAGTPLANWTDVDIDAFPSKARDVARSLDRISHLYQSAQMDATVQTFTAELLTITGGDGKEERGLVYIPDDSRALAEELARTALTDAQKTLGPDGARILLASMARALFGAETNSDQCDTTTTEAFA